jgi:cobalt/nickel transport system permease protein
MHLLDPHRPIDSAVHRAPAAAKLAGALAVILGTLLAPPGTWWPFAVLGAALALVALLSRLPALLLLQRLLLLEPLVLGVALLAWLQPHGGVVFLTLVARSTLCLLAVLLLSLTTPFHDLLRVLRRLHVPALLVTTLALMHRYLAVLLDESQRMRRARASRTFVTSRRRTWHALASVAGQLFVRSSERAERIYAAMCARGWR